MPALTLLPDADDEARAARRAHALALVDRWRALEARTRAASARARSSSPNAASCCRASESPVCSIPACQSSRCRRWPAGVWTATKRAVGGRRRRHRRHRRRLGVRVLVVADDAGIDAGALQAQGLEKLLRAQADRAREPAAVRASGRVGGGEPPQVPRRAVRARRHPLLQSRPPVRGRAAGHRRRARLVDGRRCLHDRPRRSRDHGARPRPRLPRRSAAAQGGDRRDRRPRRRSAAPTCTRSVSGLAEYVADDDVERARHRPASWSPRSAGSRAPTGRTGPAPLADGRRPARPVRRRRQERPVEMRHVIARIVDASEVSRVQGRPRGRLLGEPAKRRSPASVVGIVTNNGPLDPAGSTKVDPTSCRPAAQLGQADRLAAEHDRLHRRHRGRARRHDQARLEADPGALERERRADHGPVRCLVRRRQLRDVRARLRAALRVLVADRADRRHGCGAGRGNDGSSPARARLARTSRSTKRSWRR